MVETKIVSDRLSDTLEFDFNEVALGDGTVSAPALAFSNEQNTGIYRAGAQDLRLTVNGVDRLTVSTASFIVNNSITPSTDDSADIGSTSLSWRQMFAGNGSLANPSYTFGDDPNSGLYSLSGDNLGFSCGGTLALRLTTARMLILDGDVTGPGISFINDSDTGIYRSAANTLNFVTGGLNIFQLPGDNGLQLQLGQFFAPNGSSSAPTFTFTSNPNTGLFQTSGSLRLSTNGVEAIRLIEDTGGTQIQAGTDGGTTRPAFSFISETNTGFYRASPSTVGYSGGGSNSLQITSQGIRLADGTGAAPSITFLSDPNLGFYRETTDRIGLSLGGLTNGSVVWGPTQVNWNVGASGAGTMQLRESELIPNIDNAVTLGKTGNRWTAVWAVNGTIQTSHSSTKEVLGDIDENVEVPRGIYFRRPGEEKVRVGFLADNLPQEAFFDEVNVETSAPIGVLCSVVRRLDKENKTLKQEIENLKAQINS